MRFADQAAATVTFVRERKSLAEQAYRKLEEMIITLELRPGSIVIEADLCERLGVGRAPVREALQRLAYEGTVTIVPRYGIVISDINPVNQLKLLGVRRELERFIATSAARHANPDEVARFRELADSFEQAAQDKDEMKFVQADSELNALLTEAARNEYAKHAVSPLRAQSTRFWYLHFKRFGDLTLICRLHAEVARAVAQKDTVAAAETSDRLIDYVEEYTRAALSWEV